MSDSGFIEERLQVEESSTYHELRQVAATSHAVLTVARRGGRLWMLKSLPEDKRQDPLLLSLQRKEYEVLTRLNHPSVVNVYDMVSIPSLGPTIVMEYVDGTTLDKAGLQLSERRRVARQLADALAYVHSCQVVHRDLKPANVMVTHNGKNVKIIDFGLADTDAYTILKQPAGTQGYISEEQQLQSVPDVRNDIYSLGVIFSEMKLGWQYQHLIRRMLLPISERPSSMSEVLRAMDKAERIAGRLAAVGLVLLGIIAVSSFFLLHQPAELPRENVKASQPIPLDTPLQAVNVADTVSVEPEVAVAPSRKERSTPPSVMSQGRELLDAYMHSVNFTAVADTVTMPNLALGEAMNHAIEMCATYAREHAQDEDSCLMIQRALHQYIVDKYWTAYHQRIVKLIDSCRTIQSEQ